MRLTSLVLRIVLVSACDDAPTDQSCNGITGSSTKACKGGQPVWGTSLLKGDTRASRVAGSGPKIWEYGGIVVSATGAITDPGLICGVGFDCPK